MQETNLRSKQSTTLGAVVNDDDDDDEKIVYGQSPLMHITIMTIPAIP